MPSSLKTIIHCLFSAALVFELIACGEVPKRWDPQRYSVKKGDTLYSIAWRYEKDFRQIAEWNNIYPPYAIYPGQRLVMQPVSRDGTVLSEERPQVLIDSKSQQVTVLTEPAAVPEKTGIKRKPKPAHVKVKKDDTLYSIARREGFTHYQLARWNHLKAPYLLQPGQQLRLSPSLNARGLAARPQQGTGTIVTPLAKNHVRAKPLASESNKTSLKPTSVSTAHQSLPTRVDKWHWPVKGRVVKTYRANDTSRKGIGISGKSGQTINAAAGGTIVYSGNGLINYGNLIIIKHSHSFLSAYAHNKSLLVKEGESVRPGQAIAKIGKSDSGKPQLHFEIRRNGKPVNPLNYLPKS